MSLACFKPNKKEPTLAYSLLDRPKGTWIDPTLRLGKQVLPGITVLTGYDLKPFQTAFSVPELADPYLTTMQDSVIISGTAQYHLKFQSLDDVRKGGPYQIVWNDFYYSTGTPMEGDRYFAHSWDMKPVLWPDGPAANLRLWDPIKDLKPPRVIWYGGHMRPQAPSQVSVWPDGNFSRDVFAFLDNGLGQWLSLENSIFSIRSDWPRPIGNFLGHRYGHQIVMIPQSLDEEGSIRYIPAVFYEEVTAIYSDGSPAITKIFMDEMATPTQARGKPIELLSPVNPISGKFYPSAIRENGAGLVEGPLYFRFLFEEELWEAISFSAGSFYSNYPSCFATRKVTDGLQGKPYQIDMNEDGSDLNNAGLELGKALNLIGGPGRPAVIVGADGVAILSTQDTLQVLVHGYRQDILPDNDYGKFPTKYRLDQMFRTVIYAPLQVTKNPRGGLRFQISVPQGVKPNWEQSI